MTDARRKVKIALLQNRMTYSDFAKATRLSESTIDNVLAGRGSDKSRQAITNALQLEIFPSIKPTETRHLFRKGTTVEFVDSPELAAQWREECSTKVRVRGCTVRFLDDVPVTFLFADPGTAGTRRA